MVRINKVNIIYFLFGILISMLVMAIAGAFLYIHFSKGGNDTKMRNRNSIDHRYSSQETKTKDNINIFIASSLDRIFQDGKTLLEPNFTDAAVLSSAKNEYESFQIVITNGRDILKSVKVEVSDLVNKSTSFKIDKHNITWRIVGYVPTEKPYYPVKFVGFWPDPLLPAHNINIKPGVTQPFWVTVYIPRNTPAGIYKGSIKVLADGAKLVEVPLLVRVYDFTLPIKSHLKTAFDFYPHLTASRYPKKEKEIEEAYQVRISELNERYVLDMLKHRINPILNIDPLSQRDLGRIDTYRIYGLNNFAIGKRGGTFGNNWPESDEKIEKLLLTYRTYGETLKFNKLIDYHYIYTWDEGQIGDPRVQKVSAMIHQAYPGLKNMVCYHGFWEPQKEPEWGTDIDIWCFQIDNFNEAQMNILKGRGMEIWMYVSGPGGSGSPNLAIDFDSIDYRIIPWLCWKYDIKGFLYWCVNFWPYVNPFKSAMNTKWEQNGNGLLFYPGENGPIDSLRLEIFRDGMEDYEYIHLLAEKIQSVKDSELVSRANRLLNIDNTIAISMRNFTKDTSVLLQRRQQIAQLIEEMNNKNE